MLELFNKYRDTESYQEALLVGRNLFNKNPGNAAVFNEYFSLLCEQSQSSANTIDSRRQFISQAEVALAFFSENAELDAARVEEIKSFEGKLTTIVNAFNEEVDKENALAADKTSKENNDGLALLEKLRDKLRGLSNKQEFDKVLGQIGDIDNVIDKDAFDTQQQERYSNLTKTCTETINMKLAAFERNENVSYNQQAVEAFKKTFDFFRTNDYSNENHKEIMRGFFAYDASRLFNEALVYYNHVYSYILSKMDDDEKFILTKYAVLSERKEG